MIKDKVDNEIYEKKKDYIEDNINEFSGNLSTSKINAIQRWIRLIQIMQMIITQTKKSKKSKKILNYFFTTNEKWY